MQLNKAATTNVLGWQEKTFLHLRELKDIAKNAKTVEIYMIALKF